MLKIGQKHLKRNDAIDPRQELLEVELKYKRVCLMYHNDFNNNADGTKNTLR